ncbi:hypothetical protein GIB67_030185 [Kingdonia uniflora]|uniref:Large ribosomal subunit protein mL53 n=1 Tax=Kingdonia uniflora TaxID=39325 RepID=A0A7J7L0N5_9MAGN|nr:hypothetical protein GIB67_030185 [Kingdonia uniflora]
MLKFLSKVKIEFNALDPRTAACMEFLAQCNARKAKESNPACQLQVKRRTDDHPPEITVTFVNGVEEKFDATSTSAQNIRTMILDKGQFLETEQMFRDNGETWPVVIPEEELHQTFPGTKNTLKNWSNLKFKNVGIVTYARKELDDVQIELQCYSRSNDLAMKERVNLRKYAHLANIEEAIKMQNLEYND